MKQDAEAREPQGRGQLLGGHARPAVVIHRRVKGNFLRLSVLHQEHAHRLVDHKPQVRELDAKAQPLIRPDRVLLAKADRLPVIPVELGNRRRQLARWRLVGRFRQFACHPFESGVVKRLRRPTLFYDVGLLARRRGRCARPMSRALPLTRPPCRRRAETFFWTRGVCSRRPRIGEQKLYPACSGQVGCLGVRAGRTCARTGCPLAPMWPTLQIGKGKMSSRAIAQRSLTLHDERARRSLHPVSRRVRPAKLGLLVSVLPGVTPEKSCGSSTEGCSRLRLSASNTLLAAIPASARQSGAGVGVMLEESGWGPGAELTAGGVLGPPGARCGRPQGPAPIQPV